jgi:hypothetical protein
VLRLGSIPCLNIVCQLSPRLLRGPPSRCKSIIQDSGKKKHHPVSPRIISIGTEIPRAVVCFKSYVDRLPPCQCNVYFLTQCHPIGGFSEACIYPQLSERVNHSGCAEQVTSFVSFYSEVSVFRSRDLQLLPSYSSYCRRIIIAANRFSSRTLTGLSRRGLGFAGTCRGSVLTPYLQPLISKQYAERPKQGWHS